MYKIFKDPTFILFMVTIVVFVLLYIFYNPNNFNNDNLANNSLNSNSFTTSSSRLKKIKQMVKDNEHFMNITLKQLNSEDTDLPINIQELSNEHKDIVSKYYNFFNEPTVKEMEKWAKTNENNKILTDNLNVMISNYNKFNKNVEDVLQEINYDLLKQLQKNYAKAHKINIKRQIDLENIDYLPQRFD